MVESLLQVGELSRSIQKYFFHIDRFFARASFFTLSLGQGKEAMERTGMIMVITQLIMSLFNHIQGGGVLR